MFDMATAFSQFTLYTCLPEKNQIELSIHKYLFIVFMWQVNYKPNLKLIYFDVAEN